jgi:hypothetical protein
MMRATTADLGPVKYSSTKGAVSSADGFAEVGSFPEGFAELDLRYIRRGLNDTLIGNLCTDVAKERVDSWMVTLDRCAGAMHLKQAGNNLQAYDRHDRSP